MSESPAKLKTNPIVIAVIVIVVIGLLGYLVSFIFGMFFVGKVNQALKQKGAQYKADDTSFTYKDKQGNTAAVGSDATLPADFPKDFPIYPNAKVFSAIKVSNAFNVTLRIQEKAEIVISWYDTQVASKGWKVAPHSVGPLLSTYEKDDQIAHLVATERDGGTYLKITIVTK